MINARKLAVVGAGDVGATLAYAALIRGLADAVALYDIDEKKVAAQAADLQHGLPFCPPAMVDGSADVNVIGGANVVVVTAGAKQKPDESRLDLGERNVRLFREMIPKLADAAPDALLLIVTNPVDVLTLAALKITGRPREQVLGSGTVLDSARFRALIGQRLRVAPEHVHAYVAGEHGETELPLWSSASVGGVPLRDWAVMGHGRLDVRGRTEITQQVRTAAAGIIEGKGATNYAIGLSAAEIIAALTSDVPAVLPVSGLIEDGDGVEGVGGVCLSLPRPVSSRGVEPPLPTPLNDAERAGLRHGGETLRDAARAAGL